jgi:aminocarboxymuconate-semialdehyde decarboxylase
LWEELSRRRTVVFVHPTTGCCTEGTREFALSLALGFLAETTIAIGRLVYSGTFERHAGIRWIFSHLGGTTPFLVHRFDNYAVQFPEARQHITKRPSEYLSELTFDTVSTHPEALRCAFATFGPQRFVFGTDYPHVPGDLRVFVEVLRASGLDPEQAALVGHRNARTLLGV